MKSPSPRCEEQDVLTQLREHGALRDGHFRLSSGRHSDAYAQCALALQYPAVAEAFAQKIATKLRTAARRQHDVCDVVLGPALGGVVIAYELARALGVRALFCERDSAGVMQLRRGFHLQPQERVLVCEDVVTTGRSAREAAQCAVHAGGNVVGYAAIVERRSASSQTHVLATTSLVSLPFASWPAGECPLCARGVPVVAPGSRQVA